MNANLTRCPVCAREVSIHAESCPGCGQPFRSVPPREISTYERSRKQHGIFYYAFFGTISVMLTIFILGFIGCLGPLAIGSFMAAKQKAERQQVEQKQAAEVADRQAAVSAAAQKQIEEDQRIEAQRKAAEELAKSKHDQETKSATIKFLSDQAILGRPMAQYRLAEKYISGDGVSIDLDRAKFWLQASCTNGYSEASNLLQKIERQGLPSSGQITSKP